MNQYPHVVTLIQIAPASRDADGNPTEGASSSQSFEGRYETNGSGKMIQGQDGSQITYNGIVYLPIPSALIAAGDQIEVTHEGNLKAAGEVKQYSEGFFNARIWL